MLNLGINVGECFRIGSTLVKVVELKPPDRFVIEIQRSLKQRFEISARPPTEILPGVKITAGRQTRQHRAVVCIDAPKDIRIERLQHDPEQRFGSV